MEKAPLEAAFSYLPYKARVSCRSLQSSGHRLFISGNGDKFCDFMLTHYRPAMPFGNRKFILEDLFSFVLLKLKKISPLWKPEI